MLDSEIPDHGHYGIDKFLIALAITVLSVSYYLVYSYELNIPQSDDFSLSIILLWLLGNVDGLLVGLSILFNQLFEHKLVVYRLIACLDYYLFGNLDFKHLAYIGNLSNVILLVLLLKIIRNDRHRRFVSVPVILLFLISFMWAGQAWRNGAGANYVLGFAGWAFYFVSCEKCLGAQRLTIAVVLSTLAVFSSVNGLLVSPVIFAYFLYRKQRLHMVVWATVSIAQWGLYFLCNYRFAAYQPIFHNIFDVAIYFIVSFGSSIAKGNMAVALVVGLVLILFTAYLTLKRYVIENAPVFLFLIFNVLTFALVSSGRSAFGLEYALSNRHAYTSLITIMLVYIGVQEMVIKRNRYVGIYFAHSMAVISLVLSIYSCYTGIPVLELEKSKRINNLNQWLRAGDGLSFWATLESDFILSTMLKSGLYTIPVEVIRSHYHPHEIRSNGLCGISGDDRFQVDYDVIKIPYLDSNSPLIRVEGIIKEEFDYKMPIFIVLKSEHGHLHIYPTHMVNLQYLELSGLWEHASRRRFVAMIPTDALVKGKYRVGVCNGERLVFNESQSLVKNAIATGLWRIHWIKDLIIEERRSLIGYAQSVSSLSFDR